MLRVRAAKVQERMGDAKVETLRRREKRVLRASVFTHLIMDELPPFTEIDHCLLIHDNRHEDEGAADVELVLFFWPNHVELGQYAPSPPLTSPRLSRIHS